MSIPNTNYGAERIARMLEGCESIYFIGIGGVNMSSLAEITQLRGCRVGGSDRTETAVTQKLESLGIEVFYSHEAEHLAGYGAVVYTVAIAPDNPEYVVAQTLGLPCFSRADYLGYVMTSYTRRIGVSGMHGKSTCTSMCASALYHAAGDPTVLCGAVMPEFSSAYRIGGDENFVFEACEYMDSFLSFRPNIAVVLNIEMDHVDYFKDIKQIRHSYSTFAGITGSNGYAVVNDDDENVRVAMSTYVGHLVTFGVKSETAQWYAANITAHRGFPEYDVFRRGDAEPTAHIRLSVPGMHNVYNSLAAFVVGMICGLDPQALADGLESFRGAARRMEFKGKLNGADVFDDYGHHPTEVKATLLGAQMMNYERVFCVFQPHTYTRTSALWEDFIAALKTADRVFLADIYAARETDTLGISSALLAREIGDKARFCADFAEIAANLTAEAREGDAVIIMGAGDIYKVYPFLPLE